MIKLEDHRSGLINIKGTIEALEHIDRLIDHYSEDLPGPAYCKFNHVYGLDDVIVQFDRQIMITALTEQRQKLVNYFATLGIEV